MMIMVECCALINTRHEQYELSTNQPLTLLQATQHQEARGACRSGCRLQTQPIVSPDKCSPVVGGGGAWSVAKMSRHLSFSLPVFAAMHHRRRHGHGQFRC